MSDRPRLNVQALVTDASTIVADPSWRFTRSPARNNAFDVVVRIDQDDTYYTKPISSISIFANEATADFNEAIDYGGTTSGDLTMNIVPQDYYAVSDEDASATVVVKAQSTGPPMTVNFPNATVQVTEGETATVPVDFTLAAGLATPRDGYGVYFELTDEETEVDFDYPMPPEGDEGLNYTLEPGDWQLQSNGTRTQRKNLTLPTLEDTEVEANETFYAELFVSEVDEPILGHHDVDAAGGRTTVVILDDEDFGISSIAVTSTPTNSFYGSGDTITFRVTFNAEVSVDMGPRLRFRMGGVTREATAAEVVFEDAELYVDFTYTVASGDEDLDGISWGADAITLDGGAIYIDAKESPVQRGADLDHDAQSALSGHKVDAKAPELVSATGERDDHDPGVPRGPEHDGACGWAIQREEDQRDHRI